MDLLNPGPQQQAQRQLLTEQQIGQMHDLAEALNKNALDSSPIYSPWAGAARMADALVGNLAQSRQAAAQRDITGYTEQQLAKTLGIPIPGQPAMALPSAPESQAGVRDSGPASIRNNNPGAQWPGPVSQSFGATGHQSLRDGNQIATFNDPESGAAAQFALLGRDYVGMPLSSAIHKWSGGNSSAEYAKAVEARTGLSGSTVITPELLQSPQGIELAKAMAHQEAGREFPLSDEQWQRAQRRGFGLADLNPISSAQAAEAPKAATGLTEEALRAAGEKVAPGFEGRFGNQPQTFDQGGNPLPQGGPPATFSDRFGTGMILPPKPDPGIATPAPEPPALTAGAPQGSPQAMPHVAVTPRPAGTGQPIPGTMSLQQQHAILNLIGQPATHELGLALAKKYLMPEETNAPTGFKYMGTPGAGYTPSGMPAAPQELPSVTGPFGAHAPSFLPGSRTPQVTIPTVGGAGADAANDAVGNIIKEASKLGAEHRKKLMEWLQGQTAQ